MGTKIGGISIGVGADVNKVLRGFDAVESRVQNFRKSMSNIRLTGIIKGDPFSATKSYFSTMKSEIDVIYSNWSKNINYVTGDLNKFAEASRMSVTKTIAQFDKLNEKMRSLSISKEFSLRDIFYKDVKTPQIRENLNIKETKKSINDLLDSLSKTSPKVSKEVDSIRKKLSKITPKTSDLGIEHLVNRIEGFSKRLRNAAKQSQKPIIKEYEEFGRNLKNIISKIKLGEFRSTEDMASVRVHKEHIENLKKRRIARAELNAKIARAIELNRDASVILDLYQQKEKAGIKLTSREINHAIALTKVNNEYLKSQRLKALAIKNEKDKQESLTKSLQKAEAERKRIAKEEETLRKKERDAQNKASDEYVKKIRKELAERKRLNDEEVKLLRKRREEQEKLRIANKKELEKRQRESKIFTTGISGEPVYEGVAPDKIRQQILRHRSKLLQDILLKNVRINKEIEMGINISKNKERLAKNYLRLQEEGFAITKKQERLISAIDIKKSRLEDLKALQKLKTQAERYTSMLEKNAENRIISSNNINRLINVRNSLISRGMNLTKEQNVILDKHIKKQRILETFKGGFLSPGWFKQRAGWFLQLRGFWGLYRVVTEIYQATKDLEKELAVLRAVTLATDSAMASMKDTVLSVSKSIAVDILDISKGMIKLGQAGLSVAEVNSAIKSVSVLAAATMTDMDTAADLVTTTMRAWGLEATKTGKITDILANTVNTSKVNIKGLSTALQYLTGVAPQVGMSLRDTSAVIGIMANRGIKMSKVGTGFRSLLGELLKPSEKFRKELYNVGLTLKDVDITSKEIQERGGIIHIIETLSKAGFDAETAFRGLDRRAAAAISALISGAGDLRDFANSLDATGTAAEMAAVQMETLESKVTLLRNKTIALTTKVYDSFKPLLKRFVDFMSQVVDSLSTIGPIAGKVGVLIGAIFSAAAIKSVLSYITSLIKVGIEAKKFAGILVALRGLVSIPSLAAIGIISGVLLLIKYTSELRYNIDKQKESLVNYRKEFNNLSSDYATFKNLADDYTKAMDKGNIAEATRIAQQHEELQKIHEIKGLTGEYNELIEDRIKLYEENINKLRETSREEGIALVKSLIAAGARNKMLEDQKTEAASIGDTLFSLDGNKIKDLTEDELKAQSDAIKYINMQVAEDVKSGIITSADQGIKVLQERYGAFWNWLAHSGTEATYHIRQNLVSIFKGKEQETTVKRYLEGIEVATEASSEVIGGFIDKVIDKNDSLKEFFNANQTAYNRLKDLAKKDLGKAMEYIRKLGEHYKNVTDLTYKSKAKGLLESFGIDTSVGTKEVKSLISNIAKTLEDKDISTMLSGLLLPSWEDFRKEVEVLERGIKSIGDSRSEVEKKIASVREKYIKEKLKYDNVEKNNIKAVEKLRNLEEKEIKAVLKQYDEKVKKEITSYELRLQELKETNEFQKQRNKLEQDYRQQLKDIDRLIEVYLQKGFGEEEIKTLQKKADLMRSIKKERDNDITAAEALYKRQMEVDENLLEIAKSANVIEDENIDKLEREVEILVENEGLLQYKLDNAKQLKLTDKEILDIREELLKIEQDLTLNYHNQLRETNYLYNAFYNLKEQARSFNDLLKTSISDFITGTATGMGNMMFELSTGFQQNKQEVVNLKGEIKSLKNEKDDLLKDGILSEDEAERVREINNEMNNLKNEIDDLEDPIKSLGESFKNFFKSLIDGINEAITRWIAMKIVMNIVGNIGGVSSPGTIPPSSYAFVTAVANGGILGKINSFRKFSNGGKVSSPTLAAIGEGTGDNREIVVPMKNIKQDHVSGYMREEKKQTVNILNVVTEEDLAIQLSKPMLGQVIVNRVYKDKNNLGILSRG